MFLMPKRLRDILINDKKDLAIVKLNDGRVIVINKDGKLVKEITNDLNENEDLESFVNKTKEKHGLQALNMYHDKRTNHLKLDNIIVSKDKRKQGVGSAAMHDITSYADHHKMHMSLTTATKDDHHGTTSSSRLKSFYKKHGFVENKGRNKDFTIRDNMIRKHKS